MGLGIWLAAAALAPARVFTDHFVGQGEACWGNLYIRTETIEWDTAYSVCQSDYIIIKKTFQNEPQNFDFILYKLKHLNRGCRYPYIGLFYYDTSDGPGIEEHWLVMGFPTFEDFNRTPYREVLTGKNGGPMNVLGCALPYQGGVPIKPGGVQY